MKKALLIYFLFFGSFLSANAQKGNLVGIHIGNQCLNIKEFELDSKAFFDIDTTRSVEGVYQGQSTFDSIHNYYFLSIHDGILVYDIQSNSLIKTIANPLRLTEIEYNPYTNKLIGFYQTNVGKIFASLSIDSGNYTIIDTLHGVHGFYFGSSTFDAINQRYFFSSNGVVMVDATTGKILKTIQTSQPMVSLEYNCNSGKLLGLSSHISTFFFVSLDLDSNIFEIVDTLRAIKSYAQGMSCFDVVNNRFMFISNLGVTTVNASSGKIIDTAFCGQSFTEIEYYTSANFQQYSASPSRSNFNPNPLSSHTIFQFAAKSNNSNIDLYIYDISGNLVKKYNVIGTSKLTIAKEDLPTGIYFVKIDEDHIPIRSEKLLVTE